MADDPILVVEDQPKIAELLKAYLEKDNFTVTCLDRGDRVIPAVKSNPPALILLDIMLPGMDGVAVCREVRAFTDVPIIMVTAKVDEIDRLIGLEIGADDYICKPFSPREVVARVKAVLRRARPKPKQRQLTGGPIILDLDTRQVTVAGNSLDLTPSEFNLLKVLLASPERVFTRGELLQKVLGYQYEGYDRSIDSHVKNLRHKIADHLPGKDVIATVYGVGYKLSI